jgi:A/G-specific adenine glycosylase
MSMSNAVFAAPSALVAWYEANHRDLPWRQTRDPYAIWLSETMLQQTRVETVIPYYDSFLKAYPTVSQLAQADEGEVLKRWQGLGYYSRARNLHRAAQAVVREHEGVIPDTPDSFASLPGVGPYTTGAVMSIAFDQPVPAVDGNVLRVMSRYLAIEQTITDPSSKRAIATETETWLQTVSPNLLTQALMELGARVCVPRDPKCDQCPIQPGCTAFRKGLTTVLPLKKPKPQRRRLTILALWCESDGYILMEQRQPEGLLASMWQLPALEVPENGDIGHEAAVLHREGLQKLQQLFGKAAPQVDVTTEQPFAEIARFKHIFTHLEWDVRVLRPVNWTPPSVTPDRCVWASEGDLSGLALPRVYDKVLSRHFR